MAAPALFADRPDAGRELARRLADVALGDPVVLALPRGGVPVAAEVAAALGAPLSVLVVRKVGLPGQPELGIGAVAEGWPGLVRSDLVERFGIPAAVLDGIVAAEREEVGRRVVAYRGGDPLPAVAGRDVVVVDDGLATGVTAEAAVRALRGLVPGPARVLVAAPVCAPETVRRLARIADDVVCVAAPRDFDAVGAFYEDFTQTTDDEVVALLGAA